MRTTLKLIVPVVALIAQWLLASIVVEQWVGHYFVVTYWDCGWSGTCVDNVTAGAVVASWWCIPISELAIATGMALWEYRSTRYSPLQSPSFVLLISHRFRLLVSFVPIVILFLVFQNSLIMRFTDSDFESARSGGARAFLRLSAAAFVVEFVLVLTVLSFLRGRHGTRSGQG